MFGTPGANDNGSGVASVLELAGEFASRPQPRSIAWVFFANEEPPYFQTPYMGSFGYARECRLKSRDISAMLSIETNGYYSDQPGSQHFPPPLAQGKPDRGNFLGFVANLESRALLTRAVAAFRRGTRLPAESAAAPADMPGVGWSDHWSFWQAGYPALMVTDTAPYRYPWYHSAEDTPDKLDYARMALGVKGLSAVVRDLASA